MMNKKGDIMRHSNPFKTIAVVLLVSVQALASHDGDDKELVQTFGQLVPYQSTVEKDRLPSPTPPTTPTSWSELATTLATSPYYTAFIYQTWGPSCLGTQTVPFFVNRLEAIEKAGTSKEKILDDQMAFIASTWHTWDLWDCDIYSASPLATNPFYPRRYPLIYKFLVNRSTQNTQKRWLAWLGC